MKKVWFYDSMYNCGEFHWFVDANDTNTLSASARASMPFFYALSLCVCYLVLESEIFTSFLFISLHLFSFPLFFRLVSLSPNHGVNLSLFLGSEPKGDDAL